LKAYNQLLNYTKLPALYNADVYVMFQDSLKNWGRQMSVLNGDISDGGFEYPTANAIYFMPNTKLIYMKPMKKVPIF
jgi:hypothetical protein